MLPDDFEGKLVLWRTTPWRHPRYYPLRRVQLSSPCLLFFSLAREEDHGVVVQMAMEGHSAHFHLQYGIVVTGVGAMREPESHWVSLPHLRLHRVRRILVNEFCNFYLITLGGRLMWQNNLQNDILWEVDSNLADVLKRPNSSSFPVYVRMSFRIP